MKNEKLTGDLFVSNTSLNGVFRLSVSQRVDENLSVGDDTLANVELAELFRENFHATFKLGNDHISVGAEHLVDARRRPENHLFRLRWILHQLLEWRFLDLHWGWRRSGAGRSASLWSTGSFGWSEEAAGELSEHECLLVYFHILRLCFNYIINTYSI